MNKLRMAHWLIVAALLYLLALVVHQPQLQTMFWKTCLITVAAHVGYWIDKTSFRDTLEPTSEPTRQLRRAIIIAAAMLAVSMGL